MVTYKAIETHIVTRYYICALEYASSIWISSESSIAMLYSLGSV